MNAPTLRAALLLCAALSACGNTQLTVTPGRNASDTAAPRASSQPAPLTAPVPESAASSEELSVLAEVNAARAQPRSCGEERFNAAPALRWNGPLAGAALEHSRDMARTGYREETPAEPDAPHTGSDHSSPQSRIDHAGYAWTSSGENVAAGFEPGKVMAAWLASPGHCASIMNATYQDTGLSFVRFPGAVYSTFYTQTFGRGP